MTITSAPQALEHNVSRRALWAIGALLLALMVMRLVYAGLFDLRTDEAYYWTWSKENVLSFLDHPPMIAWFIRAGTAIFGDTGLGVRVMGIDAWGWDAPLHLQADKALAADASGIFWAAHQAGVSYCQIERLCNLGALPATGFTVSCFPLRVTGGSAGPTRAVAIVGG